MQIESILIFIALIVFSSFANKRKEAQHKQRQQQKRESQTQPTQQTQPTKTNQPKPGKRTLQDLFREMQQEMETEYKKATELSQDRKKQAVAPIQKKEEPPTPQVYKSTDPRINTASAHVLKDKKPIKPSDPQKKSPLYEHEIKDRPIEVGFDMSEEAIISGIIFSEVIGKPKAMR